MAATHEDILRAVAELVVTSDGPQVLVVDAEALMTDENQVRYWRLVETKAGEWCHYPSGTTASLGDHLWSKALVYLDRPREANDGE